LQIYDAKTYNKIYENSADQIIDRVAGDNIVISFEEENVLVCGDLFFKLVSLSKSGESGKTNLICRFGIHTSFLTEKEGVEQVKLDLYTVDPCSIRKEKSVEYD
jgi:hypothetical protein